MPASTFASSIISTLASAIGTDGSQFTEASATTSMTVVAQAISDYLKANTTVYVAYAGTIPGTPPTPDPLVADTFQITGECAPTGPSNSFDDWIKQIEANIIAGFTLSPSGTAGLVFPLAPFLNSGILTTQASLLAVHDISDENPQQKVWEVVCQGIMDWINSTAFNPTPSAASNPATTSTGIANIASIIVT